MRKRKWVGYMKKPQDDGEELINLAVLIQCICTFTTVAFVALCRLHVKCRPWKMHLHHRGPIRHIRNLNDQLFLLVHDSVNIDRRSPVGSIKNKMVLGLCLKLLNPPIVPDLL